ncbi:MFS transporter [Arthrobacter sp.]|uniref:MFS transporter n=1 Tax=Arthrobacter sp. TaxID=1667 RepID=UPI00289F7507|nr:MFS transporter [Arthrobacter sp.]
MTSRPDTAGAGTNRQALSVPAFRRLSAAWVFTNFADSALYLTAAVWMKHLTGSDAAAGLVFACLGLPALLAPVTGWLADHLPRRGLLVAANAGSAAVVLPLLLVSDAAMAWLIYPVMFLYGTGSYLTSAAQSGLLKDLLEPRLLAPGNGLLTSIDQGLRIVSPLLGAGLFALWGMAPIVVLTVCCFAASALVLAGLPTSVVRAAPHSRPGFWTESVAGAVFLARHRVLRTATLAIVILVCGAGALNVTEFAAVDQGAGLPPEFISVLASVQGVFAIIGGLSAAAVIRRIGLSWCLRIGIAVFALGIPLLATASVPLFFLAVALAGTGVSLAVVSFNTLRQSETPSSLQGRTAAATQVVISLPQVASSALAAVLISVLDYRALTLAASVMCLAALLPLMQRRPSAPAVPDAPQPAADPAK